MLTNEQFDRTRRLALRLAGIELVERHRELLGRRSRRLGLRDNAELDALLGAAEAGATDATRQMLHLLTTRFTGFFRHPRHFEVAAGHALRAARRHGQARVWSAAAATGEEPYSLAMALIEDFGRDDPPASVLATDIDAAALAVATRGEYGALALRELEPGRHARFFAGVAGRRWQLVPAVQRLVKFGPLNLASVTWTVAGPFDVIFCRNVLMYLALGHRYAVLERMASLLAPDGLLILDPAEHLGGAAHWFTPGTDGVYSRRRAAAARVRRDRASAPFPSRPSPPPWKEVRGGENRTVRTIRPSSLDEATES